MAARQRRSYSEAEKEQFAQQRRDKVEEFLTWIEQQVASDLFATTQMIELRSVQERPR